MTWLFFVGLCVILSVANSLMMRVLAVKSENPRAFSAIFNSFAALFALLLVFLIPDKKFVMPSTHILLLTAIVIIFSGLYERLHFYVRKNIEASTTTLLFQLSPVVTFITSVIFLKESLSLVKLVGALLIISGNILIVYKNKRLRFNKYVLLAFLAATFLGIGWTFDKVISTFYPLAVYALIIWAVPIIFIIAPAISIRDLKREFEITSWKFALMGAFNLLAYYFLLRAFALAEASKVIMIYSTQTVLVVLSGIVLLAERDYIVRKILAAFIVFIGVLLIR